MGAGGADAGVLQGELLERRIPTFSCGGSWVPAPPPLGCTFAHITGSCAYHTGSGR